jgi:hypothetical protein
MENADAGVKSESSSGQPGFRFDDGIEIVEHGVRRVDR